MDERFSLSTSNKVFLGVIVACYTVFFFAVMPKTPFLIGTFGGRLLCYFLFPGAVGWFIWRVAGKNPQAGSVAFNIMLGLVVLGQLGAAGRHSQQRNIMQEMEDRRGELKEQLLAGDKENPAAAMENINQYVDSVRGNFDRLAESGTESDKLFFRLMKEYMTEIQAVVVRWNATCDAVQSDAVLNYARLKNASEYQEQRRIVNEYLAQTKAYQKMFDGMASNLKVKLQPLGTNNELALGAVEGATRKYLIQRPVFEQLTAAHLDFGQCLLDMLDALERNADKWSLRDDELEIDDDAFLSEYNKLTDRYNACMEKINNLADQILKLL